MLNVIEGNLLDVKEGVIIHQVNNKHVMGSGIAKDIRAMYPAHYNDYMATKDLKLGWVVATKITDKPLLGVIGFIAQDGYGRDGQMYTKYDAFTRCLITIRDLQAKNPKIKYYMPMGIGCGLGGGDWNEISKLISSYCPFMNIVHKTDVKPAAPVIPEIACDSSKEKEFRLIIAGGREFNNYELLKQSVDHILSNRVRDGYKIVIVSGKARGADSLGERYATERGYRIESKPANWDAYGKSAGYKRNAEMADYALGTDGGCVVFWDGVSRGTSNMIDLCVQKSLLHRVIRY